MMQNKRKNAAPAIFFLIILTIILSLSAVIFLGGCRQYDNKFDAAYFFKTDPEKAALDFIYAMENRDAEYIYDNLLLDRDRMNISREKFAGEMSEILSSVESISITRIVYLGYENNMSRVVLEFEVEYTNGNLSAYKKYIYLQEENGKWKIVFDKTFI